MDIKIRYTWKRKSDGEISQTIYTLDELQDKAFIMMHKEFPHKIELVARDLWTGLQDKNEKDVYANDIVDTWPFYKHQGNCKGNKRYQKVTFSDGMFATENFDFGWEGEGCVRINHCILAGSVYTNPELITKAPANPL